MQDQSLLRLATAIVAKALSSQPIKADSAADMLQETYQTLQGLTAPSVPQVEPEVKRKRAKQPAKQPEAEVKRAGTNFRRVPKVADIAMPDMAVTNALHDRHNGHLSDSTPEDDDNVVGEITTNADGELEIPERPEPMF